MTPPELTPEDLAELRTLLEDVEQARGKEPWLETASVLETMLWTNRVALISMSLELLRLRSALTFLLHARDPDFDFGDKTGDQIELKCAERMGWQDPSAKGG